MTTHNSCDAKVVKYSANKKCYMSKKYKRKQDILITLHIMTYFCADSTMLLLIAFGTWIINVHCPSSMKKTACIFGVLPIKYIKMEAGLQ